MNKTLIEEMLKSKKIRKIYDVYIIKEIPFEIWVKNTAECLLKRTEKEKCVYCGSITNYNKNDDINIRKNYIEGAG